MRLVSGEAGVTRVWRDGHSISTWFLPCDDRRNHRVFGRSQFERVPVYIVMKSRTATVRRRVEAAILATRQSRAGFGSQLAVAAHSRRLRGL